MITWVRVKKFYNSKEAMLNLDKITYIEPGLKSGCVLVHMGAQDILEVEADYDEFSRMIARYSN
jgi:hypothetical protein